jgi:hypothetical protein
LKIIKLRRAMFLWMISFGEKGTTIERTGEMQNLSSEVSTDSLSSKRTKLRSVFDAKRKAFFIVYML